MTQSNRKKQSGQTHDTGGAGNRRASGDAEQLSKSISDSAQQIWLAGVGAFGRAQVEGSRLFEGLVKEGVGLEKSARAFADGRATEVRDAVGSRVGEARTRASGAWERLEKIMEDRVQKTLVTLGVPDRKEVEGLRAQIDALDAELRRQRGDTSSRPARKNTTGKTAATKKAVGKQRATGASATPKARKVTKVGAKTGTTTNKTAKKAAPRKKTAGTVGAR